MLRPGGVIADYATLLRDRVTLSCRSVDRIFLQGYVPKLQTAGWVCRFLRDRRGFRVPSSAACGVLGDAFVRSVRRFAEASDIPVIHFKKGEDKEAVARPLIDAAAAEGGVGRVVLIGIAQERSMVWRSWRTRGCDGAGRPWMAWGRQSAMVNHFYFYLWDPDWGGAFWKTNSYPPYPVWIWLNGHEWAKRQCVRAGIGFTALDNGFASCDDRVRLQRICDRLGPGAVKSFFWRWCRRLPSPFTDADRRAGYVYELAFRQFEVADTRVFDRPAAGRAFFEGIIRDHLDIGRPRWSLSPSTGGSPHGPKQYFKEHRALRTETVICDTRDFGIGRRVNTQNWRALRAVGEHANQRLCDAQAADARPAPDVVTLAAVTRPSTIDGQHVPALRFGDPRVMAIFAVLCGFAHLIRGFDNRTLTRLVDELLGGYTRRQATYDLRRLRRKGLIERIPHTHRYLLTPHGRQVAVLFTKTHERILAAGFARLDPRLPHDLAARSPLATAWRKLDHALNDFITAGLAAA